MAEYEKPTALRLDGNVEGQFRIVPSKSRHIFTATKKKLLKNVRPRKKICDYFYTTIKILLLRHRLILLLNYLCPRVSNTKLPVKQTALKPSVVNRKQTSYCER